MKIICETTPHFYFYILLWYTEPISNIIFKFMRKQSLIYWAYRVINSYLKNLYFFLMMQVLLVHYLTMTLQFLLYEYELESGGLKRRSGQPVSISTIRNASHALEHAGLQVSWLELQPKRLLTSCKLSSAGQMSRWQAIH